MPDTASSSPLKPWRSNVRLAPVAPGSGHAIHTYFNISPESPDGRWVLYFFSTTSEAHTGELRILERTTGRATTIARSITTEDAHRVACQQWASDGRRVIFHDLRDDEWVIVSVDIQTLEERVLAANRQLAWGQPNAHLVPVYGPHWAPGNHRDLELLNVETGEIQVPLTAEEVKTAYPGWIAHQFEGRDISIFFPCLSPDRTRIFFKLAAPLGGHFRSKQASVREGLVCYDLQNARLLFMHERWGHPAWHPDSRIILNAPGILIEADTGRTREIPDLPRFPGSHPSVHPGGRIFTTDTRMAPFGGSETRWGVAVAHIEGQHYEILHTFDGAGGATSWRPPHPHPIFSADGNRLYFNVNEGEWTQLWVAEKTV